MTNATGTSVGRDADGRCAAVVDHVPGLAVRWAAFAGCGVVWASVIYALAT